MLNYVAAEWYKLFRRKGLMGFFALLLLLEAGLFAPWNWSGSPGLNTYCVILIGTLPLGFFLAPIIAAQVFDDQFGRGTLKNEIVYGIPRSRVYLGKLTTGMLMGTQAALIVLGWYLLLAVMSCGLGDVWSKFYLRMMLTMFLAALPLWLASFSLTFLFLTLIRSAAAAVAVNYLVLVFSVPLGMIWMQEDREHSLLLRGLDQIFFISPMRVFCWGYGGAEATAWGFAECWLMGLAWGMATTAVGLLVLKHREI